MDIMRVQRTQFHREIGVFRYAEVLERLGVLGPTRQMLALTRFVEEVLGEGQALPHPGDEDAISAWLNEGMASIVGNIDATAHEGATLAGLALRTEPYVAWDLYRDFAELLNLSCGGDAYAAAASRLRGRGIRSDPAQLHDIAGAFVLSYLPCAVRSFRLSLGVGHEAQWLATVFYRFALKAILVDRTNREHLEATLAEVREEQASASTHEQALLAAVPKAMASLPMTERMALERYFGFGGSIQTLAQIGRALGRSEHLTRAAVVHGLAAMVAKLDVQGVLDEREMEIARRVYGTGMSLEAAARDLGTPTADARRLVADIGAKLRRGLRPRTTARVSRPPILDKEQAMASTVSPDPEWIITQVRGLKATPKLVKDAKGVAYVDLAGQRLLVARIRRVVCQPPILQELQSSGVPLDWVVVPDATFSRPDLDPADLELAEHLTGLGRRTWIAAMSLYHALAEGMEKERLPRPDAQAEQALVDRIYRILNAVGRTLEGTLSRPLRRMGEPRFRIDWKPENRAVGRWEDDVRDLSVDVKGEVVVPDVRDIGDIPEPMVRILADLIVDGVRSGDVAIPGFPREEASTSDTVWLRWTRPILPEATRHATVSGPDRPGQR